MDSEVSVSNIVLDMSITDPSISYHHNIFEKHHRFIGWLGLAVYIPQSHLKTDTDRY
jgi:hypothetical protein